MPRHYSRRMGRRSSGMAPIIQSYKKVLNFAPASRTAATDIQHTLVTGVDSVAAGQTSVTDSGVPTGAKVKFIEIQFAAGNPTTTPLYLNTAIEMIESGQSIIPPLVVGGHPQRNQVMHQTLVQIGERQNFNRVFKFKVPPRFQRVREGRTWRFVYNGDVVYNTSLQVIYKFYR